MTSELPWIPRSGLGLGGSIFEFVLKSPMSYYMVLIFDSLFGWRSPSLRMVHLGISRIGSNCNQRKHI